METLITNHQSLAFFNSCGFLKEEYHKWHSQFIDREFEMLVFGHAGFPVIIFPTSRARYYQAKDFGLINAAAYLIDTGKVKIYCPDSLDNLSWYNTNIHPADRVKTQIAYEEVILNDVIEFAFQDTGFDKVGLAGCSFGGYHSANIAFRNPDKVSYLFTMGGASNVKRFLDGYYDDNCYFNNPPDYLANLTDDKILDAIKKMGIILGTGEFDMCLDENKELSRILSEKQIPHWLDVRKNTGHDWNWWKEMFVEYLSKIKV
jgi:esterase/lipase superfamily enzyme